MKAQGQTVKHYRVIRREVAGVAALWYNPTEGVGDNPKGIDMVKFIVITIAVFVALGFLFVFPYITIGILVTAFCIWRGWFIAAGIAFIAGITLQALYGDNDTGGGDSFIDDDRDDGGWEPNVVDFFEAGKISEHYQDKKVDK